MSERDEGQRGGAADHILHASQRTIDRVVRRCARFLNPWPGYAVPADELLETLTTEYAEAQRQCGPRIGIDDLLERHRRLLSGPKRHLSSEEWTA